MPLWHLQLRHMVHIFQLVYTSWNITVLSTAPTPYCFPAFWKKKFRVMASSKDHLMDLQSHSQFLMESLHSLTSKFALCYAQSNQRQCQHQNLKVLVRSCMSERIRSREWFGPGIYPMLTPGPQIEMANKSSSQDYVNSASFQNQIHEGMQVKGQAWGWRHGKPSAYKGHK